ncbi:hypothetical protein ACEPAF_3025 [Sanghuangporus sanghuang]
MAKRASDSNPDTANPRRRLQQIQSALADDQHVLDLPDGLSVSLRTRSQDYNGTQRSTISIGSNRAVLEVTVLPREAALVLSALGTPFEKNPTEPRFPVLELEFLPDSASGSDAGLQNADIWAGIYALWTLLHVQEVIPVMIKNSRPSVISYLLKSGLARCALNPNVPELFLLRSTFWQGAGQGPLWNNSRGWLRYTADYVPFPHTPSFTRSSLVIAQHPLRPPKPPPGQTIYARYVKPIGKMLTFHMIDVGSKEDMDAFHRWMNDPRVHAGWGEAGDEEKHRGYVRSMMDEPSVLPLVMSWDGERMGYAELVWIKENHVATYVPGIGAQDYDRGLHVLVGEDKYRGHEFSQAWFRSLTHYMFLADPRTWRIIGEPKRINGPIIRTSEDAGMHLETKSFYFPYKHSVMTMNLRERLFKEDMFL